MRLLQKMVFIKGTHAEKLDAEGTCSDLDL